MSLNLYTNIEDVPKDLRYVPGGLDNVVYLYR